jgi:spore maturation protein CgeB
MRVVVLGAAGVRRTEMAIVRAARSLGHTCRLVDVAGWRRRLGVLADALVTRLAEGFRPDAVIFTRHAHHLEPEQVRELCAGRVSGVWYFDYAPTPAPELLQLARAAGRLFVTCRSQLDAYRAAGIPEVLFLPQAMDPAYDRPATRVPSRYRCDLSFVGSGQYPDRHELLRRLAAVGKLQIRGPGWEGAGDLPVAGGPIWGKRFARVVAGAAISIGAHAIAGQEHQVACDSNRIWKVLGCGGFYLGAWQPGSEEFARDGVHCAWYRGAEEAVALAQRYLTEPGEREAIAIAGREHALRHHTYAHRLPLLLEGRGHTMV